jgi:hypothetical protein
VERPAVDLDHEAVGRPAEVGLALLLGALDGPAQVVGRHDGAEVEQRPGDRGRRDAAFDDDLARREVITPVDPPPGSHYDAAVAGDGELDERAAPGPQAPQPRRAAMAEDRAVASRRRADAFSGRPP